MLSSDEIAAVVLGVIFAIVLFIADVGSTDKIVGDGLQYRVVDEAVVVDSFIVDVSAAT